MNIKRKAHTLSRHCETTSYLSLRAIEDCVATWQSRKKDLLIVFFIMISMFTSTGCNNQKEASNKSEAPKTTTKATKVVVEKLVPHNFKKQIRVQGTIKPINKAFISARMGGIIDSLNVKEGDYVKQGDLLFQTDKANLENAVLAAQKLVETSSRVGNYAKADIPVAKANKGKVELDYNRDKGLFKNGAISRSDFEGTEVSYKSAIANVEKAEALTQAADTLTQQLATSLKIAEKNLADYQTELLQIYNLKHEIAVDELAMKCEVTNDYVKIASRVFYNQILLAARIPQFAPFGVTKPYFSNGMCHYMANDKEQNIKWLLNDE